MWNTCKEYKLEFEQLSWAEHWLHRVVRGVKYVLTMNKGAIFMHLISGLDCCRQRCLFFFLLLSHFIANVKASMYHRLKHFGIIAQHDSQSACFHVYGVLSNAVDPVIWRSEAFSFCMRTEWSFCIGHLVNWEKLLPNEIYPNRYFHFKFHLIGPFNELNRYSIRVLAMTFTRFLCHSFS